MFHRKKAPILSETYCRTLENLRMGVEVLTGQRVRIKEVDFNTYRGKIFVGEDVLSFALLTPHADLYEIRLGDEDSHNWYVLRFDEDGTVRTINDFVPRKQQTPVGEVAMWWVGRSATDRWEEPLFKEDVERCAQTRGVSLNAFLGLPERSAE